MSDDFLFDYYGNVKVWIDGSCLGNGKRYARAGYGIVYNWDHYKNVSEPVNGRATNNAGEIQAATRAIIDCANEGFDGIKIFTDSKFLLTSVNEWMPNWEQNGFCKTNGQPLANQDDFIDLSNAINDNDHMRIFWRYVPAHSGNEFNEEADRLAKLGAQQY